LAVLPDNGDRGRLASEKNTGFLSYRARTRRKMDLLISLEGSEVEKDHQNLLWGGKGGRRRRVTGDVKKERGRGSVKKLDGGKAKGILNFRVKHLRAWQGKVPADAVMR